MVKRKPAFTASVGSSNYNTNDKYSDVDKKMFDYPSFEDYFSNRDFSKAYTGDTDVERHDIRKLPNMLWKSNVNFTEVLFANEFETYDNLYHDLRGKREDIARMNLPYLYEACMGMAARKEGDFIRDGVRYHQSPSEELLRKVCKHAATRYRIIDFIERYKENGFTSFADAMTYADDEHGREFILGLRSDPSPDLDLVKKMVDAKKELVALSCKEIYRSHEPDLDTFTFVTDTIKDYCIKRLKEEL